MVYEKLKFSLQTKSTKCSGANNLKIGPQKQFYHNISCHMTKQDRLIQQKLKKWQSVDGIHIVVASCVEFIRSRWQSWIYKI